MILGFGANPITQSLMGAFLGIAYGMWKEKSANRTELLELKPSSYKQYMVDISKDMCIAGLRSYFPVAGIVFDLAHPVGACVGKLVKGPQEQDIMDKDIKNFTMTIGITWAYYAAIYMAAIVLNRALPTIMVAVYAAKDIVDHEVKSPGKTWGETVLNAGKSAVNGIVSRIHGVRYLPALLTKCYQDLCSPSTTENHVAEKVEEVGKPERLPENTAPSTFLNSVTTNLSAAKKVCEDYCGYFTRLVRGNDRSVEHKVKML